MIMLSVPIILRHLSTRQHSFTEWILLETRQSGQVALLKTHQMDRCGTRWTKRVYLSWGQNLRLGQCQRWGGSEAKDLTLGKPQTSPTHHPTPVFFPAHHINCPNFNPTVKVPTSPWKVWWLHIAHSQLWEPSALPLSSWNVPNSQLALTSMKPSHSHPLLSIPLSWLGLSWCQPFYPIFGDIPFFFSFQALTYLESH